jgi:hypothetical protein
MKGIFVCSANVYSLNLGRVTESAHSNLAPRVIRMMKLDTSNRRDWQGFTRILEVMTFLDEIETRSKDEIQEAVDDFCDLPPNPGQTMSMEEVVFWAGVASGIEYSRHADEDTIDAVSAEKMLVFSSIFAHSVKNAVVDLALGDLEGEDKEPWHRLDTHMER